MPGRFFLTTPIYYVNDAPHIGHAYTTVIADALARWHRLSGDEVFFLTGTDEHGLKVAQSAEEAGLTPQEQADRNAARFRDAWDLLGISYDDFIRTTEPRHHAAVQELLSRIKDNGDIELDTYEGPYCVSCEAYYQDSELVDGIYCPIHTGKAVTRLKEENWFFRLSRYEKRLLDWIESNPEVIQPEGKRNEVLGFIRQGLDDVSITRTSLSWGVPVPWAPGHVFYVWYDALINYATAVGFGSDPERFEAWWPQVHPPDRQGDHPVPLRVLAGDAAGGGARAPEARAGARLAAARRREAVEDRPWPGQAHRHRAGAPRRRLRRRRVPLPLPA